MSETVGIDVPSDAVDKTIQVSIEDANTNADANADGDASANSTNDSDNLMTTEKYERLHHLLDKTSLFSKFLAERMPSRYQPLHPATANNSDSTNTQTNQHINHTMTSSRYTEIQQLVDLHQKTHHQDEHDTNKKNKNNTDSTPAKKVKLHIFQMIGIDWLISLYENGLNGILADEVSNV